MSLAIHLSVDRNTQAISLLSPEYCIFYWNIYQYMLRVMVICFTRFASSIYNYAAIVIHLHEAKITLLLKDIHVSSTDA